MKDTDQTQTQADQSESDGNRCALFVVDLYTNHLRVVQTLLPMVDA